MIREPEILIVDRDQAVREAEQAARQEFERLPEYAGQTYYDMPPLKSTQYSWAIAAYFFVGGLAAATQFIATVVDFLGRKDERKLVSAGRYIALAGALVSPPLLIIDLLSPQRWYNMLRIYRRTSAMSIGSWALSLFGVTSGVAAVGQALDDFFGWKLGRYIARLAGIPASIAGGVVAIYTGTLLASTNIPFWSSVFPFLSSLFASSAVSSAAAALTIAANHTQTPRSASRRLNILSIISAAVEFFFASIAFGKWRREGTASPLRQPLLGAGWWLGVFGLGIAGPLVFHAVQYLRPSVRRPSRRVESRAGSDWASIAVLVGTFLLRAVFVFGGRPSARNARDYFRQTNETANPANEAIVR